jgi:hypothetical protein
MSDVARVNLCLRNNRMIFKRPQTLALLAGEGIQPNYYVRSRSFFPTETELERFRENISPLAARRGIRFAQLYNNR